MKLNVTFVYEGSSLGPEFLVPDECPVCGRLVPFTFVASTFSPFTRSVQTIIRCTFAECLSYVLCFHEDKTWELVKYEPVKLVSVTHPEIAEAISPDFVSIHREATEAEARGLVQIAGPGYRKAFEFLIKDYAKSAAKVEEHPSIESQLASQVVNNYISDTRVQAVAKRALWLGNDETHYLRKWEAKDINDLKMLIKLTLEWIDIEKQSAAYIEDMPDASANKAETT